jgi:hypothetical protein
MTYNIIKTNAGYMVEQSDGDYLCDANGNNLFDWYHEADALIPKTQSDVNVRSKYETITVNGYWNAIPELGLPEIEPFENMTVALGSWDGEEDADDERIFFYLDGKTPIGNHGEFTITEIIEGESK